MESLAHGPTLTGDAPPAERLAAGAMAGDYVIEVTRASGEGPASGTLTVDAAGTRQQLPFNLGPGERRKTLGLCNVRWQSRLVPL